MELIQKSKGGNDAAFLNSIISLFPLYLYTLRTTADGDSLTASSPLLVHIPERTKHSRRRAAENTTGNSRSQTHRSQTQQQTATAPPYSQEARKKGRKPGRETASAPFTKR